MRIKKTIERVEGRRDTLWVMAKYRVLSMKNIMAPEEVHVRSIANSQKTLKMLSRGTTNNVF